MSSSTPSSSPNIKKEILQNNNINNNNNNTNFLDTPNITPKQYVENNVIDIRKSITSENLLKSFETKNAINKKEVYKTPNVSPPINRNENSISNHPPILLSHAKNLFSNMKSNLITGNFDNNQTLNPNSNKNTNINNIKTKETFNFDNININSNIDINNKNINTNKTLDTDINKNMDSNINSNAISNIKSNTTFTTTTTTTTYNNNNNIDTKKSNSNTNSKLNIDNTNININNVKDKEMNMDTNANTNTNTYATNSTNVKTNTEDTNKNIDINIKAITNTPDFSRTNAYDNTNTKNANKNSSDNKTNNNNSSRNNNNINSNSNNNAKNNTDKNLNSNINNNIDINTKNKINSITSDNNIEDNNNNNSINIKNNIKIDNNFNNKIDNDKKSSSNSNENDISNHSKELSKLFQSDSKINTMTNKMEIDKVDIDKADMDKMKIEKMNIVKLNIDKINIDKMNIDKMNINEMDMDTNNVDKKKSIDKMEIDISIDQNKETGNDNQKDDNDPKMESIMMDSKENLKIEKASTSETIFHKKWHPKMVHRKRKSSHPIRAIDTSNCISEAEKCIEGIVKIEIYPILQTHPTYLIDTPKEAEHLSLETPLKLVTSRRHKYHNLPHNNSHSSVNNTSYNYSVHRLNTPPPKVYPLSRVISRNLRTQNYDNTSTTFTTTTTTTTITTTSTNTNTSNTTATNNSSSSTHSTTLKKSNSNSRPTRQPNVIGNKLNFPNSETYKKMQFINPPQPIVWKKGSPLEVPPDTPLYDLLQKEEIQTCSLLRILPAQYLRIRDILIQGYKKNGYFLKKDAKKWCRGIDVNKTAKLYDWWVDIGWLPFKDIIEAEQLEKERKRNQRKR